jgi:hypothetical protein
MPKTLRRFFRKISGINQRYREPRIAMSMAVKMSLFLLRIYLIFLVCLMVYKFILLLA